MKVYIKNKLWSIGGGSSVVDENKNDVFKVKGRAFSITKVKYICDLQDKRLFKVRNKWFNFFVHKAYIYDENKRKIATVKDKFFNTKGEYFVLGYKDEIKIQGNFFGLNSQILKNGETVGNINRQFSVISDAFELDADQDELPFLVALVIAIDNITDKKYKRG